MLNDVSLTRQMMSRLWMGKRGLLVALVATGLISCGDPVGPKRNEHSTGLVPSGVGAAVAGSTAAFTYSCNGLACNFDGSSSTGAATYSWNFGNGIGGGVPVHPVTYAAPGTYTVTLTTTPSGPASTISQTVTVTGPPPSGSIADFTYSCTGLSCNFDASTSTGATAYSWNFGDGTGGGVPIHPRTYAAAGTYTVTMTTLPSGPSSVKSRTIVVGNPPPTAPTVTANSPTNGSISVPVGVAPTVTFSKAMNTSTLTGSTVTLTPTAGGGALSASLTYLSGTNTLTLTPASALTYSTSYTLTVTTAAQASDGTALAAPFTASFTTAAGPDVTPPVVNSVTPANGTSGIAVSATISVTFSEPMDATTMNTATVALSANGFATVVPATVSYNAGTNTATLTPTGALAFQTPYAIRVSTGAKDVAGNALAAVFSSGFTTINAPPSGSIADFTYSCANLSCNFDGSTSSGATGYSWNFGDGTGGGVPVHPRTYAAAGTYTVTLTTLPSGPSSVMSKTIVVGSPTPQPPTVTGTSPANGSGSVAVGVAPTVTFSRAMNTATLNNSTVSLAPTSGGGAVSTSLNYAAGTNTLTITPASALSYSTSYTLTVTTGAQASDGLALSTTFTSSFTTVAAPPPGSVADFTYSCTGLSCNFDGSISTGATGYSWNFGDGTGGGAPAHPRNYAAAGTYTVTLTTLPSGALSVKSRTIVVGSPPPAPPTVTGNTPANGSSAVSVSVAPTVTFSKPMNASTFTGSTVTLAPTAGGSAIAASLSYAPGTNTLTVTPSSALTYSTSYTLTVTTGAQAADGAALASTFTSGFTTGPAPDLTPPTVNSVTPANGASNVSLNPAITVTFSEPMNASTITGTTVTLKLTSTSAPVAVTFGYNAGTNTATLTPTSPLSYSTGYTVGVSTGAKDIAGNSLASAFSSGFTTLSAPPVGSTADFTYSCTGLSCNFDGSISTGATAYSWDFGDGAGGGAAIHPRTYATAGTYTVTLTTLPSGASSVKSRTVVVSAPLPPPTVTANTPINGSTSVSTGIAPTVTFSKAMNAATFTSSTVTLVPTSGGAALTTSLGYTPGTNRLTVTPTASLSYSTAYTLTITTGAQASDGTSLASAFTSSFTTGAAPDLTPPTVTSVTPANGTSNVGVNPSILITFSEPMDASTITGTTVTLKVTSTSSLVGATVGYNAGTSTATLTPTSALAYSTSYTIGVSTGAKDVAGNSLSSAFSSGFTTSAPPDITPPVVVGSTPTNNAEGVSINTPLSVSFTEPMNPATVSSTTLLLNVVGGGSIVGVVSYTAGSTTASFTPSAPLQSGVRYTLTATTGMLDVAGNPLSTPYSAAFMTLADLTGQPYFQATTNNNGVDEIHMHVIFAQNGSNLSLPTCGNGQCILLARNDAGSAIIGPPTPGQLWATMTALTGTLNGSSINFTITLDNGRTFSFSGTVNSSASMTGTFSGLTQPAIPLLIERGPP